MAAVGVHVELTVRLWREDAALHSTSQPALTSEGRALDQAVYTNELWRATAFNYCDVGSSAIVIDETVRANH